MKPLTERLVQGAAIVAAIYFGYYGVVQLVVNQFNGQVAQRQLANCQQELMKRPPAAPAPTPAPTAAPTAAPTVKK
jgi:hypothetical protein